MLPAELRQQDQIEAGQKFDVKRVQRGEYRLIRRPIRSNEGMVDWLLACFEDIRMTAAIYARKSTAETASLTNAARSQSVRNHCERTSASAGISNVDRAPLRRTRRVARCRLA